MGNRSARRVHLRTVAKDLRAGTAVVLLMENPVTHEIVNYASARCSQAPKRRACERCRSHNKSREDRHLVGKKRSEQTWRRGGWMEQEPWFAYQRFQKSEASRQNMISF